MYYHSIIHNLNINLKFLETKTTAVFLQTVHINVENIKPPTMYSYANIYLVFAYERGAN
jgi:hypothetical protein